MSIVQDILQDAAIRGGLQSLYDPQDIQFVNYSFAVINRMLDQWTAEISPLFNIVDSTTDAPTPGFTLVGGQAKYTLGPTAVNPAWLLNIRPPAIADLYLLDNNNVSYYQTIINADQYSRLIYKVAPGRPYKCYVNYNAQSIDLTFYPTPAYVDTAHVLYFQRLTAFTSLSQTITYPPGYEDSFINNMAIRLAVAFGKTPPPAVVQAATWGKTVMNAMSENKYILQTPMPTMKRRFFNILTGETI